MNMKQKLTYMLIGCLFTLAGFVISSLTNTPTQAQDEKKAVFDKIVCKELEIVNDTGKKLLRLGESDSGSGFILVYNSEQMAVVGLDGIDGGGTITIANEGGKETLVLRARTVLGGGGEIEVKNFDGNRGVTINVDGGSGVMQVYDCVKEARRVGIWGIGDVSGAGLVAVYGDNQQKPVVAMRKAVRSSGGIITVVNEGNKVAATMGTEPDGPGYISTYNADGKRLVYIGSSVTLNGGKNGAMSTYNADGMRLVNVGSTEDAKNGLLSTYNADGRVFVKVGSVDGKSGSLEINNSVGKQLVYIGSFGVRPNDGLINIYNHKGKRRSYTGD